MDGPDTSNLTDPTEREKALGAVNAKMFNTWVENLPFEQAYFEDVIKDPAGRVNQVQGQVNADLQQKVAQVPTMNPTGNLVAQDLSTPTAGTMSKAVTAGGQDVQLQRLAGGMDLLKMGAGEASTAQTGMSGLAKSAVDKAVAETESDWTEQAADTGAMASLAGGAVGGITAGMRPKTTTPAVVPKTSLVPGLPGPWRATP